MSSASSSPSSEGDYIVMNGRRLDLDKHPTDFTVVGQSTALPSESIQDRRPVARNVTRVQARPGADVDEVMSRARQDAIAHHVYLIKGTGEEIVIDDRIILTLDHPDDRLLEQIIQEFHLKPEGRMGESYVLRVTSDSGGNPVKVANRISRREGVRESHPHILVEQRRQGPAQLRPR